jgi:hypothetical protein
MQNRDTDATGFRPNCQGSPLGHHAATGKTGLLGLSHRNKTESFTRDRRFFPMEIRVLPQFMDLLQLNHEPSQSLFLCGLAGYSGFCSARILIGLNNRFNKSIKFCNRTFIQ